MAEGIEKTHDKTVVNFVNHRLWAVQGRELAPVSYTQLVTALVGRRKVASVNKKPTDLSLAKSRLISHVTVQGYLAWGPHYTQSLRSPDSSSKSPAWAATISAA